MSSEILEFDPMNPFDVALIKIKKLHDKKKADYSNPADRFSNFKVSANHANITPQQAIEVLIGIKCARLAELTKPDREPQNESLSDTYLDRAVYAILAYVYYDESIKEQYSK